MASQRIKCKFCDTYLYDVESYVDHLEEVHNDMIPKDMVPWQFYYYIKTGKTHGNCVICKHVTSWNDVTHKYNRFCTNPKCKEKYKKEFEQRMIGKYGKVTLLNDPEQQRKMLANRSISGVYEWSDRIHKFPYTGSFEKEFLEFLDLDLHFDPNDIMAPSPHNYKYIYDGMEHFYFPDFFIPSLKLEIEIKDAGLNPNREINMIKEKLKDSVMQSNKSSFSYIKIVNKDHMKFLRLLNMMKEDFSAGIERSIFMP